MKILISDFEDKLNCKIKKNYTSIGFDFATRAGITYTKTDNKYITFDFLFIEFKTKIKEEKYSIMVNALEGLILDQDFIVVEDIFVGMNSAGSMELAKYHAFALSECIRKKVNYDTITAVSCRGKFNIKTTKKAGYGKGKAKIAVADWLKNVLNIKLEDEDISDSIILSLLGIIEGMDFLPISKGGKKVNLK